MYRIFVLLTLISVTLLCMHTVVCAENTRPVWPVAEVQTLPSASELAEGGDWREASCFSGLTCFGTGLMSISQPVFWIGYNDTNLIIAWRVPRNASNDFVDSVTNRDGSVWNDDAVEVFLDPKQTFNTYYQLIVNPNGTIYDAKGRESSWNGKWSVTTAESRAAWAAVVMIPFSEFGAEKPTDNAKWGLNLAVDRTQSQRPVSGLVNEEQIIMWSLPAATLHEPQSFGTLIFGTKPVRLVLEPQKFWKSIKINNASISYAAQISIKDSAGKDAGNYSLRAGQTSDTVTKTLSPGRYKLSLISGPAESPTALLKSGFVVTEAFEAQISYLYGSGQIYIRAANSNEAWKTSTLIANAVDSQGKLVASLKIPLDPKTARGNAKSKPVALKAGTYTIVFKDAARGDILSKKQWKFQGNPVWLGSTVGKTDDNWVPKIWTALKIKTGKKLSVGVWGREYRFAATGLPESVVALNNELLAAPMNLSAKSNGNTLNWKQTQYSVTSKGKGAVGFTTSVQAKDIRINCTGRTEFDGFIRLDYKITSSKRDAVLNNLTIDIPVKNKFATLIHHFPRRYVWLGIDLNDFNARALDNKYWKTHFLPHVWLGNEEKGIQWLCESAKGWNPADSEKAIEILPGKNSKTLRLNIIGKNTKIGKGLKYTFMFQASPVKPMGSDRYYMGYLHTGGYGMEKQPYGPQKNAAVRYPLKGNMDFKKGTVEITVIPNFDSTDPAARNTDLFTVHWPEDKKQEPDNLICLYWNQDDKGMREVTRDNAVYTRVTGKHFPWKPGEVHTVAFVWGGDADGVYVDGKLESSVMPGPLLSAKPMEKGVIELGGPYTQFTVRQIRISSIPRSAEELGKGADVLKTDSSTLLLDRFDNIVRSGKERISKPVKSANNKPGIVAEFVKTDKSGINLKNVDGIGAYTQLDYQHDLGAKIIGYHEYWTDFEGDTSTTHVAELKSLTDAIHKKNMKLILYTSWMIADINPEYPLFAEECLGISPNMFIYTREPKQTDYGLCSNSIWRDRVVYGISEMFRKYGPDGIYTDGLTYPGDCTNELHGCGFIGPDGKKQPTQNILSIRDAMKRIYRVMELQGKKTYWVAHTSGSITLPTLSLVDAYLDGEHLTGQPRPFQLPLDMFRAEYMGHNFGIPALFLVYQWNSGMTEKEGFAECLLHDTELGWNLQYTTKMWKLWKDYRPEKARFVPYWKPGTFTAPKGILVSYYIKPDGDCVVVVVNTRRESVRGSVGIKQDILTAKDAFTGTKAEVISGKIYDTFDSWDAKIYRVKTKK